MPVVTRAFDLGWKLLGVTKPWLGGGTGTLISTLLPSKDGTMESTETSSGRVGNRGPNITEKELRTFRRMRRQGYTDAEIKEATGRSQNAIGKACNPYGIKANRVNRVGEKPAKRSQSRAPRAKTHAPTLAKQAATELDSIIERYEGIVTILKEARKLAYGV